MLTKFPFVSQFAAIFSGSFSFEIGSLKAPRRLSLCFSLAITLATALVVHPISGAGQPANDDTLEKLSADLKPLLLEAIPEVLYEKEENWGHQTMVFNGLKWRGLKPEVQKSPRNDGRWRRIKIVPRDMPGSFVVKLSELKSIHAEKQTFKVQLALMTGVHFEQQNWESGIRLWSGSVRARLRLVADLQCESLMKWEQGKSLIPDLILRLRVEQANVAYDQLHFEHVNGVGGEAAEILGQTFHSALKQWRPSIERRLLERANIALVKAADTREIRIGLTGVKRSK